MDQALVAAANVIAEKNPNTLVLLGSLPAFFKPQYQGHLTWCAKVHIALEHIPRGERYALLSRVLGRDITSTKDLKLCEAIAICNYNRSNHDQK